jgi:proteasome lid subunit RPN8/RPN11
VKVALPERLRAQILAEAHAAAPRECCGLVLGRREGVDAVLAAALHPARNVAVAADRFEIAPEDHFRALRAAREAGQAVIGCYHSHPNGVAQPSAHDVAGAGEDNFLWLIATPAGTLAAFVYRDGVMTGADWVTSSS